MLTALFDTLIPVATLALVGLIFVERVASYYLMRWLEFRADAAAARKTSTEAVASLFDSLSDGGAETESLRPARVFSTHPTYAARVARLRR